MGNRKTEQYINFTKCTTFVNASILKQNGLIYRTCDCRVNVLQELLKYVHLFKIVYFQFPRTSNIRRHKSNTAFILFRRVRHWPNIQPIMSQCLVFAGERYASLMVAHRLRH